MNAARAWLIVGLQRPKRFPEKACPGLDPGWIPVRVKKTRQIENADIDRNLLREPDVKAPLPKSE
jgi:hypothetical protein